MTTRLGTLALVATLGLVACGGAPDDEGEAPPQATRPRVATSASVPSRVVIRTSP